MDQMDNKKNKINIGIEQNTMETGNMQPTGQIDFIYGKVFLITMLSLVQTRRSKEGISQ